jgi:FtsZ-binding cell division protein ZapB
MLEVKTEVERLKEQVVTLSRDLADSVRDYLDLRDRCNKIFSENERLKEKLEKYKNERRDINHG